MGGMLGVKEPYLKDLVCALYCNSFNISSPWKIIALKIYSHLNGRGNSLDDATPIFTSDSGSSVLGLSNEVHNVSEVQGFSEKMGKTFDWKSPKRLK